MNVPAPSDFVPYPKTPRLFRDVCLTEKLDGTNSSVVLELASDAQKAGYVAGPYICECAGFVIRAGSRNRWITPQDDNYGFAKWVAANAGELLNLGVGRHYGEWFGGGINRGYGLAKDDKRFSLFNVARWADGAVTADKREKGVLIPGGVPLPPRPACCGVVPVLYRGPFDTRKIQSVCEDLAVEGSAAVPGYAHPEGVIVYHVAANKAFKVLLENDEQPKGE